MQIDGRTLSHDVSEWIRIMAVRRVREGERPSEVIRSYGLCRTTIYRWLRAARRGEDAHGSQVPWAEAEAHESPEVAGVPLDQRVA
jgi:transposase-like protein